MTTVAFTRPVKRIDESMALARSFGLDVMAAPSLEITDGLQDDFDKAERLLAGGFMDYVVFGSGTGVEECAKMWGESLRDLLKAPKIVSIGPNTTRVLQRYGLMPDMTPEEYSSKGIVDLLSGQVSGKRVLLVRSDKGSAVLDVGLGQAGADVMDLAAYRLEPVGPTPELNAIMDGIRDGTVDVMAFTSPLSATSFFSEMGARFGDDAVAELMAGVGVAAIGKPTSEKLAELGRPPDIVPENTTFVDMLAEIARRGRSE